LTSEVDSLRQTAGLALPAAPSQPALEHPRDRIPTPAQASPSYLCLPERIGRRPVYRIVCVYSVEAYRCQRLHAKNAESSLHVRTESEHTHQKSEPNGSISDALTSYGELGGLVN